MKDLKGKIYERCCMVQVDTRRKLETQSLNIAREIDTLNRWFNHQVLHGVINTMMNGSKREDGNDYY